MRFFTIVLLLFSAHVFAQLPAAPVKVEKSDFAPAGMTRVKLFFNSDTGFTPVSVHAFIEISDEDSTRVLVNRSMNRFDTLIPDSCWLVVNAWAPGYGLLSEQVAASEKKPGVTDTISMPGLPHTASLSFESAPPGSGVSPALLYVLEFLRLNPEASIHLTAGCNAIVMSDKEVRKHSKAYRNELRENLLKAGADEKRIRFDYDKHHFNPGCGMPFQGMSEEELKEKNYGFSFRLDEK